MTKRDIPAKALQSFREGCVIPVLPLALDASRKVDESRERALIRYYVDAGAGGVSLAVDTGGKGSAALRQRLLGFVSESVDRWSERKGRQLFKLALVAGSTKQAVEEADAASRQGFHACLIDLTAAGGPSGEATLLRHCAAVADVAPVCARAESGRQPLSIDFWRHLFEIDNLAGVVLASGNRYATLDAARALCESGKEKEVVLYTGNDDTIVVDLLTAYKIPTAAGIKQVRMVGGLLRVWAVWTSKAVELLRQIHSLVREGRPLPIELLSSAVASTDASAAILDAANGFAGSSAGVNEILRRQGLFTGAWCLRQADDLSNRQQSEIDRLCAAYPDMNDDDFVAENVGRWLEA